MAELTESASPFVLTDHARWELKRRGITEEELAGVLRNPGQAIVGGAHRMIYQSRILLPDREKEMLLRVIVDREQLPHRVVTAYRTSKIGKYWRSEP
jgi:hypothetical protein